MAINDIQCKCNACGWCGVVSDCGQAVDGWRWLACPECRKPISCSAELPQQVHEAVDYDEMRVVHLLGNVWDAFVQLHGFNRDDINDFRFAIHAAQNIVLARIVTTLISKPKPQLPH